MGDKDDEASSLEESHFCGLLSCGSGIRSESPTPRMDEKDKHSKQSNVSSESYGFSNETVSRDFEFSTPTGQPSTSKVGDPGVHATSSKKQRVWRNLHLFNRFRNASAGTGNSRQAKLFRKSSEESPSKDLSAILSDGRVKSALHLPNSTSSSNFVEKSQNEISRKTAKKVNIRKGSSSQNEQDSNNSVSTPNRLSNGHVTGMGRQVEFADTAEVYRSIDDRRIVSVLPTPPPSATSKKSTPVARNERQELVQNLATSVEMDSPSEASYLLQVHLHEGRDLVIRDTLGSSDPYAKFSYKDKQIYKSNTVFKNLNPTWNEQFSHLIDDLSTPLQIDVYDYDRFALDDFMGTATVDLSQVVSNEFTELKLVLSEENNEEYMGYLMLKICVTQLSPEERIEFVKKANRPASSESTSSKKAQVKTPHVWSSIVNVVLVEGKNLLPTDVHSQAPLPDPYVKFKLGSEKYKSKPASKTLEPKWLEQFDLHIYEDQTLEVRVLDKRKDVFMGRCAISLMSLEKEITHQNWYDLEGGAGQIFLLISISGTLSFDTVTDIGSTEVNSTDKSTIIDRYLLSHSFDNLRDVGHLTVKVFRAQGLAAADIGGKSDPFCVLELVNARLQTHTEYKTLSPEWNKIFTFNVKDIHSVLELTVFDEDPNKKFEFLGKVAVPLLKIKNGEKRWYAMKDKKLLRRSKGQILLEFELFWNPIRAGIRTVNPKEQKYIGQEPKFKRQLFTRNVMRVKSCAISAVEAGAFIQSCWNWDSPLRSLLAFVTFLTVVYFFELYMLPLILLLLFIRAYIFRLVTEGLSRGKETTDEYFESDDDDDDQVDDKEERKSIKERLQAVQDTLATVQNVLDYIASLMERIKNTFNFTQPFLSWLAVLVLLVGTVVLYFVPLRWLIMTWGINKFTKKLRSPHAIPNNELLDFLSRVPSDDEMRRYGEFRPDPVDNFSVNNTLPQTKKKRLP